MPAVEVFQFPCLSDNFGVLLHDPSTQMTASIDAPDANAVSKALADRGWVLSHILVTHHHADHTDGILPLKTEFGAKVVGPARDTRPIPGLDQSVGGGDTFEWSGREVRVMDVPGHTKGHIVYHLPGELLALVGDVMFSLGCGRVIEGTMEQMWTSLDTLRRLPGDTAVYCGHEYTVANARFALTVEPGNNTLRERAVEADRLRNAGKPTLPTTIAAECAANPFLRPESTEIRAVLGMKDASNLAVFTELRERKNRG